ncbi:short-chain dehydrogenase [Cohnella mopanensis]|uniref:short-chain dehydrogenase n=1 Tax=Cohnella mopanensis TaxID=2911966 RepID=UPI001EF7F3E2|nr:short-chain dehydrogenase [Cohnella mopanensis]
MGKCLIVGGTGMLAHAVRSLNAQGHHTTVIARDTDKLNSLRSACPYPDRFNGISLDYEDYDLLKQRVKNEQLDQDGYDLVIAWIQSNESHALQTILNELVAAPVRIFHVLGSRSDLSAVQSSLKLSHNHTYHQVQLGFVIENDSSRWHTNEEISDGVLKAIESGDEDEVTLVGTLEPRDMNPWLKTK